MDRKGARKGAGGPSTVHKAGCLRELDPRQAGRGRIVRAGMGVVSSVPGGVERKGTLRASQGLTPRAAGISSGEREGTT